MLFALSSNVKYYVLRITKRFLKSCIHIEIYTVHIKLLTLPSIRNLFSHTLNILKNSIFINILIKLDFMLHLNTLVLQKKKKSYVKINYN